MLAIGLRTICMILAALSIHAQPDSERALTVTLGDYPPYEGENLPSGGILTAVVAAAFKHAQVPVKFVPVPTNRAIAGVRVGLYDASFGWARTPEREHDLYYSDAVLPFSMIFCHQRGKSYPWQTLADLAPWRIGVTAGNYYSAEFEDLVKQGKLQIDSANGDIENLRKLAAGRIDLFPIDAETGPYMVRSELKRAEQSRIQCDNRVYWSVNVHVVFSRKLANGPELVLRVNRALDDMRKSGEIDHIIKDTRQAIFD